MYFLIVVILIAAGVALFARGNKRNAKLSMICGAGLFLLGLVLYAAVNFWIEVRWFNSLGYETRFWKEIAVKLSMGAAAGLAAAVLVYILNITNAQRAVKSAACALAFLAGGTWGVNSWETVLAFMNRVSTGVRDPIPALGMDTGFYLFTFPFLGALYGFLMATAVISAGAVLFSLLIEQGGTRNSGVDFDIDLLETAREPDKKGMYLNAAWIFLILAFGRYLDRFRLMFSRLGIVTGPGWTDVNIRIPAYNLMAAALVVGAVILVLPLFGPFRRKAFGGKASVRDGFSYIGGIAVTTGVLWALSLGAVPALFQALRVEPNEITFEKPYIKNNIEFTRLGFHLDETEERQFPVSEKLFSEKDVEKDRALFDNIRLWDWRALDSVYNQFQEIRLYYEFSDVDIDRYTYNGKYRQVMVSAREMVPGNLPEKNQTFVNRRFKYTHGYGITMTAVNEFTPEGLPDLLIKDIPPVSRFEELEVERPEIYYGELTGGYVVANSSEREFDYPQGDKNIYVHYKGKGGVKIRGLWDKFLLGWRFGGTRFFLSSYPEKGSRLMFHRNIRERAETLAPFLYFDKDPYIVLSEGKLYWVLDAYTASRSFPYSEPFFDPSRAGFPGMYGGGRAGKNNRGFNGVNYLRNSVKLVIDAYNGSVELYIYDEEDPIIKVWDRIFPGLLKKKRVMPAALRKHVRYPAGMLLTQGMVYAKYHMTDPEVFYNQEDLWVRATEKYYNKVQEVEPYYIMWKPPGSAEVEFTLILPFTPKNKQVLIGWIAGMCDGENYGRFLAYKFPKEKRVLGTQQVETKIDQDRNLSAKLTLWDQRGSSVIRGNVLAIPIEKKILYVEPIYLQAETAAYPELRLVVLMQNDQLSYGRSFGEALRGLIGKEKPAPSEEKEERYRPSEADIDKTARKADRAFSDYLAAMGREDFSASAEALKKLRKALEEMTGRTRSGK
ncbi:MAG: UPF0182 family protein [Candidatus Omnitrophica bacterium]|nr:UPF0182 family protein [Candidatus Omnitrophota bacterium]